MAADPSVIPGSERRIPEQVDAWAEGLPKDKNIVIYCVRGGSVSDGVLDKLRAHGIRARYLEGGLEAWKKAEK